MSESRPESYWLHLYWLTVLEEQKSYTRVAEKLGISKSAISQKISELERVTGKTLVHRTTRSVSLSDDGLRLVAELNEPFGQLRDIFTGACDEGGPLRGTLRLTAPVGLCFHEQSGNGRVLVPQRRAARRDGRHPAGF